MIGIFGGSGFYSLFQEGFETYQPGHFAKYGLPSGPITVGKIGGHEVAFMARHGKGHRHPAHAVNYRANLWEMKELGVTQILAPCACGSLKGHIKPGSFVLLDQFVDRTSGRVSTFYDEGAVHISAADPYCPRMRDAVLEAAGNATIPMHSTGTMVVIQGPRFSTRAESEWFSKMGWDTVGMTQYPEAILARELGICYTGIGLVTDYDCGFQGHEAVTLEMVAEVFAQNLDKVRKLLTVTVETLSLSNDHSFTKWKCGCADNINQAKLG